MKQVIEQPGGYVSERLSGNVPDSTRVTARPRVGGKFIFVGDQKLYVRGVTYGTFRIGDDGNECLDPDIVERDFAQMAANGVNTVRTYTTPARWLLDAAQRHGLYVLVGLLWDQYIAFFDEVKCAEQIQQKVRADVRRCAGHPAVLGYTIGNEIPTPIVRWYGHQRIAHFLERLYQIVKNEDPYGLVTYVNYPSTEYLDLPFLDFVCFNVYLESEQDLTAYLVRLQNLTGDRPLVLAEIGLDSRRNGEVTQAQVLEWQVRTAFASGCAGVFVFAWTDEWHVLQWIEDWDFGLTDRQRRPKPALDTVRGAFGDVPFPRSLPWPRVSVVVCTYNGATTLEECLIELSKLEYPDYEVIVVDDGSTDATAAIASRYNVRLISGPNCGLSNARNTGMRAATGEIIAYLDDDAFPDPHWLTYLAAAFLATDHAGIGGPNITPPDDGLLAQCIANAPGNPVHVLLSDSEAEHIPGCNMAFRKAILEEIGGFDPQFRVAGDDVDVCWRVQEHGWTLGFAHSAMVWHHRRNSVRAYWRQQRGYGEAEALLERKWPEKYSATGSLRWSGRLYGQGIPQALGWNRGRIYQGFLGCGLFQSLYQPTPNEFTSLPLMPEWYLMVITAGMLIPVGVLWVPLLWSGVLVFIVISGALFLQAGLSSRRARFAALQSGSFSELQPRILTGVLHLIQPPARLWGHLKRGLTPWRGSVSMRPRAYFLRAFALWSERWQSPEDRLKQVERAIRDQHFVAERSGAFRKEYGDRWDLEVRGGLLGAARTLMLIEEHGMGRQLIRLRTWPRISIKGLTIAAIFTVLAALAAIDGAWHASVVLAAIPLALVLRTIHECVVAMGIVNHAIEQAKRSWR